MCWTNLFTVSRSLTSYFPFYCNLKGNVWGVCEYARGLYSTDGTRNQNAVFISWFPLLQPELEFALILGRMGIFLVILLTEGKRQSNAT